jgi:hypothetical protein
MSGFAFSSVTFVAGFVLGFAVRAMFRSGEGSSGSGTVGPAPVPGPKGHLWSALMKVLRAFGVSVRAMFGGDEVSSGSGTVGPGGPSGPHGDPSPGEATKRLSA